MELFMSTRDILENKIENIKNCDSWNAYDECIDELKNSVKKEDAVWLLTTDAGCTIFSTVKLGRNLFSGSIKRDLTHIFCSKYSELGSLILKNSNDPEIRMQVIRQALYSSISDIDEIAIRGTSEERAFVADICSFAMLNLLKADSNFHVRKAAMKRLGPVECLDDMLSDKMSQIRMLGARAAPHGYKGLEAAIQKELAKGVFSIMVRKVSPDILPLILANRNIKSKWISEIVEERMSQ